MRLRKSPVVLVALALSAAGLVTTAVPAGAATPAARVTLPGSQPAWATGRALSPAIASTSAITVRVYLQMRNEAGAEAMAAAVSNPTSSSYRKYLTTAQVLQTFAPTAGSVASVSSWLRQSGFTVGYVPTNNMFVEATGTASQVEGAFDVGLATFAVQGQDLRAPTTDLSIPASLAGIVSGVVGVDQSEQLMQPAIAGATSTAAASSPSVAPPPTAFVNAPPCSTYFAQYTTGTSLPKFDGYPRNLPYVTCGYTPSQLRQVYGMQKVVDDGFTGAGTTVAIVDAFASPTLLADAQQYATNHDPSHPLLASQFSEHVFPPTVADEGPCGASGWYTEQSLDVEAVHAMAPGADIVYMGGSDCQDLSLDKSLNEVVSKDLAQIVSNSYGDIGEEVPTGLVNAIQHIAIQAALEGIGVYFSSGDFGDDTAVLGYPSANFPASDPWVTAVGGTSLGIGAGGQRVLETGWETTKATLVDGSWTPAAFLYGSGGGTSTLFAEPSYQEGVVPEALAAENQTGSNLGRVVPDISADGDPNTGFLFGLTQEFPTGPMYSEYRIGGTSLSSPLMAGMMALSDGLAGVRHGFLNPELYLVGYKAGGITDVTHVMGAVVRVDYVNDLDNAEGTVTSIRTFDDQGLTIKTAPGYDNVTGLGTPNGLDFLAAP